MKWYDLNLDGKIDLDESFEMRGNWEGIDMNGDGVMDMDEIVVKLVSFLRNFFSRGFSFVEGLSCGCDLFWGDLLCCGFFLNSCDVFVFWILKEKFDDIGVDFDFVWEDWNEDG